MARCRPTGCWNWAAIRAQLILVRTRNAADALSAANDILACPHVGALLLEMEGTPKCLDLVASRRLAFAANESGVTASCCANGAAGRAQRRADPLAGRERAVARR